MKNGLWGWRSFGSRFFLLCCSWVGTVYALEFEGVSFKEYKSILHVISEIQKRCPPSECIVVGLGRSPTPIMAYLQSIHPEQGLQVPLSSFRYGRDGRDPLPESLERKLSEHFDLYLGQAKKSGKRLLLVDASTGGKFPSLLAARDYIEKFITKKIDVLGIVREKGRVESADVPDPIVLPEKDPLGDALFYQEFDELAAYGSYYVDNDPNEKKEVSTSYRNLVQLFSKYQQYVESDGSKLKSDQVKKVAEDLASKDPGVQAAAALALSVYTSQDLASLLENSILSGQEWTQKNALKALFHHAENSSELSDDLKSLLNRLIVDPCRSFKPSAAESICKDPGVKIRRSVSKHLVDFKGDLLPWVRTLLNDSDSEVRAHLVRSLTHYRGVQGKLIFEEALKSSDQDTRFYAVAALAGYRGPDFSSIFELALNHSDPRVRRGVPTSLVNYQEKDAFTLFKKTLDHSESEVRSSAAYVLTHYRGENSHLLFQKALSDSESAVRSNAVSAIRYRKPKDAKTLGALIQLLNHPRQEVRSEASKLIQFLYPAIHHQKGSDQVHLLSEYIASDCQAPFETPLDFGQITKILQSLESQTH